LIEWIVCIPDVDEEESPPSGRLGCFKWLLLGAKVPGPEGGPESPMLAPTTLLISAPTHFVPGFITEDNEREIGRIYFRTYLLCYCLPL